MLRIETTRLFVAFALAGIYLVQARPSPATAGDPIVFSFGDNNSGRTGQGTDEDNTVLATRIDTTNLAGETIARVATGEAHSLLVTESGKVFSFGSNYRGGTGLGVDSGSTLIATPIDTTNLEDKRITQVAAGGRHSLLLADDGTVFSFGSNGRGQTGLGFASIPDALIATPIDMTNLEGLRVTDVFADRFHSMLLAVQLSGADFDNDGDVDGADFLAWQLDPSVGLLSEWRSNYGQRISAIVAPSRSIPEPFTLALPAMFFLAMMSHYRLVRC